MKLLFDSNVLVAELIEDHVHHQPSQLALKAAAGSARIVAAHSITECYSVLTRAAPRGYALGTASVGRALAHLSGRVQVRTLTTEQSLASILQFAQLGGRGPRLYDFLIGQVAALNGIDTIVTWNTRDYFPLFPTLRIMTPIELLETL